MKVLLVRPPLPQRSIGAAHASLCEPLELEVLAGNLRNHDVTVFDMRVDDESLDSLIERVRPDIVGVTACSLEVHTASAVLRRVKEIFPAVATVVGGPHGTARPEDFAGSYVNVVVRGQGVATFNEVVAARELGKSLGEIPGIVVNQKGRQYRTRQRPPIESLNVFPVPDRRVTSRYQNKYYHGWVNPVALVQGSFGAVYPGTVGAPPEESRVVQEVERIAAEMVEQEKGIYLTDDDALVEPVRIARLCALLKEAQFNQPIYLCTRAQAITDYPEIIEDLAEIGLFGVALALGGDNGEEISLVEKKAMDILKANGIVVAGEFVVPQNATAEEIKNLGKQTWKNGVLFPVYSTQTPFPGTKFFEEAVGYLGTPDWELFDRVHAVLPTRLPLRVFYSEIAKLYEKAYSLMAVPRFVKAVPLQYILSHSRQLKKFTTRLRQAHLDQEQGLHSPIQRNKKGKLPLKNQ